jgi:hypothetical protein
MYPRSRTPPPRSAASAAEVLTRAAAYVAEATVGGMPIGNSPFRLRVDAADASVHMSHLELRAHAHALQSVRSARVAIARR